VGVDVIIDATVLIDAVVLIDATALVGDTVLIGVTVLIDLGRRAIIFAQKKLRTNFKLNNQLRHSKGCLFILN